MVKSQYDVPGTGLHRTGEVAGRRLVCGDGEFLPRRATPTPEPFCSDKVYASWVKEANVHNIAFLLAYFISAELTVDLVARVKPGYPRRYLERQQWELVRDLILRVKMAFQHDFCHLGPLSVVGNWCLIFSVRGGLSSEKSRARVLFVRVPKSDHATRNVPGFLLEGAKRLFQRYLQFRQIFRAVIGIFSIAL